MPILITLILASAFITLCILLIFSKEEIYEEISGVILEDDNISYNKQKMRKKS